MEGKTGFFYFREIFGIVTSVFTIGTAAPIIVFMYLDNPTIFDDLETSCSLKGSFALFCLAACLEVFLIFLKSSCFGFAFLCKGRCRINCYHLVVLLHFTSCMFLFVGVTVYAVKLNPNIWYWNMCTIAAFLSMVNCFVACIFQREYRRLRREDMADSRLMKMIGNIQGATENMSWGKQEQGHFIKEKEIKTGNENLLGIKKMIGEENTGLISLKESDVGIQMQNF
ncbi:uncharacterized protein LOC133188222 [Saccostrea echinata]|uniref:uncharacterized protein LOC133188222 n=1 Tax=Saccostrea echinata TaxID=191078 RepID=UPI002A814956|nr:uncharacterized protein LOC133188222 [Saccostrea echinata]